MSLYYKYNFISPENIYAIIKEEMKSYFDTGAIDDLMFPVYTDKCLRKIGNGSFPIYITLLHIKDFQARLPDDFMSIREAWLCTSQDFSYQLPNAQYEQVQTCSTKLTSPDAYCKLCDDCGSPDIIQVIYKTTQKIIAQFKKKYLLKPGNIATKEYCSSDCINFHSNSLDSFEVKGNKLIVNFKEGIIFIVYYANVKTENGFRLIPDNYWIKEYIESFIKAKMYEQLSNQITDETYNQIQNKADRYALKADSDFVNAKVEARLETVYDKHRKTIRQMNKFRKYHIK